MKTAPDIAQRHRSTLGGRLTDRCVPLEVVVTLDRSVAETHIGQHLAWMLLNLLARQADEVVRISLRVPEGIRLAGSLGPLVPSSATDLATALRAGIALVNPRVLNSGGAPRAAAAIRVGPGALGRGDLVLATSATGWAGYVGQQPSETFADEDYNPIGAYVAACLCAGEVFKFARGVVPAHGDRPERLWLDAYRFEISSVFDGGSPPLPTDLRLGPAVIVGAGAVGNALLHALAVVPQLRGELTLIDSDPRGVDDTNLNRCVLFGLGDLGRPKASAAKTAFAGSDVRVDPVDESWQAWRQANPNTPLGLVISAVDTNRARHTIQDALPDLIIGASTNGMLARANLYDVASGGPCLRCGNPLEAVMADDEAIALLQGLDASLRREQAVRLGVDLDTLEAFLKDPIARCGTVDPATLRRFAAERDEPAWSVGFVSALAGVFLAAEYLKLSLDPPRTALDAMMNTFRFQFWRPADVDMNGIVSIPVEPGCACQSAVFRDAIAAVAGG